MSYDKWTHESTVFAEAACAIRNVAPNTYSRIFQTREFPDLWPDSKYLIENGYHWLSGYLLAAFCCTLNHTHQKIEAKGQGEVSHSSRVPLESIEKATFEFDGEPFF
jgi:hypothetical protein